jgi:sodium-dependent dicarboxylate transporter 2/3/5
MNIINNPGEFLKIGETISPAEQYFERIRKQTGLFVGPLAGFVLYLIPLQNINSQAHTLAAILLWIVIWWITEPIPIPISALMGAVLCVIFGVGDVKKVFIPFADPLIYLFLGSFIISKSMSIHGLDRRFAYNILSLKWIGSRPGRILFVFGAITAFISMWISNTATTAMMLPIGVGIISVINRMIEAKSGTEIDSANIKFSTGLMLMAAYAASAGGIGTPVGTPPNIIGMAMLEKFLNIKIPFFQWMSFSIPLLILMYFALFFILFYLHKPSVKKLEGISEFIIDEKKKLGLWSRGQKNSLIAFAVTVLLWILPGILAVVFSTDSSIYKSYNTYFPEAVAAIVGASLLFVLPINWKERKFTIEWEQAVKIDWGTLILFGGGLSLGNLMFETKLAEAIGKGLLELGGVDSMWGITLAAIFISIFVSEATSNTASANMIIPVIISISLAANLNPVPPAIGATLGASWGFMLPVSTPPNAIVYGSGLVPITKMIRAGIIFDLIGGILIWLGLRILLPLTGLS